ncbi:PREDICTED: uncharacterized protein LOC109148615 isoform X2 [Ipomoea nil]|uniref:uncharacterized protein LOC109148615 isoform X2 n=1 Tax=Ipomoea nil TaxID=35883 RepID=UPI0009014190|nr:PREDICTED: uncharacterized protein LOC109148615 isoform X2 [Ipomoea nil]
MSDGQASSQHPQSPGGGSHESGEQSPRSNVREQDRFLPIANISRIMKKALPPNGKIAKDAKETVQECVSEFISFITSEASDKCQREKRKTINGDDLLWAMATLGFEDYLDPLKVYLTRYREMDGDEYLGVGAQDGVPNPSGDGTMDLNTQRMFVGEVSVNGLGNEGTGIDSAGSIEIVGSNSLLSGVSQGQLITIQPSYAEEKDINHVALVPRSREEESRTEEEGQFYVSDLVWGKVRSHPWWPGQIFEPSAASQQAVKYFKRDSYLIAYFGDQTFAWNEVSQIKPFRTYFNQMEKQSSTESFCHAVDCSLDEVSRRVEFGLSCSCVPKAVQCKFESQSVANAGIRAESSQRDGGDKLSTVASFAPGALLQCLKSIATSPCCVVDRLGFVVARSQLLAFSRWKGYYELPAVEEFGGLEGSVLDLTDNSSIPTGKRKSTIRGPYRKRKRLSKDNDCLEKNGTLMFGNISSLPDGGKDYMDESDGQINIISSSNSHKPRDLISSELKVKRRKKLLPSGTGSNKSSPPRELLKIGERIQRAAVQLGGSTTVIKPGVEFLSLDKVLLNLSLDKVLLNLSLAAKDPTNGYHILAPFTNIFSGLREFTLETSKLKDQEVLVEKCRGESSLNYETTESPAFNVIEDSYWTDRIIQGNLEGQMLYEPEDQNEKIIPVGQLDAVFGLNPGADKQERGGILMQSEAEDPFGLVDGQQNLEEQAIFEPGTEDEKNIPVGQPDAVVGINADADNQERDTIIVQSEAEDPSGLVYGQQNLEEQIIFEHGTEDEKNIPVGINTDADNQERDTIIMQSEHEDPSGSADGGAEEDDCPTALILNFKNLESVPSATDLNKIFSRFGPLDESQTEGMHKTKRGKVVFKRRSDAEIAFNNAGTCSIFGHALISYRLNYAPRPRKVPVSNRKRKKTPSTESNDIQSLSGMT